MVCMGFKPRTTELKVQINPLSYGGPHIGVVGWFSKAVFN